MYLEEKIYPGNLKRIAKGLGISGIGIVEYSVKSDSGHIIAFWDLWLQSLELKLQNRSPSY